MGGLGPPALVRLWSARRHETEKYDARQCEVATVAVYRFPRVVAGERKMSGRFPKPGVASSILAEGAGQ